MPEELDPSVSDSILDSIKKLLGVPAEYDVYDLDISMHINSVFATFHQFGLGPSTGYFIEDRTKTWTEYIGEVPNINSVKTLVYLKVRLLFDPPTTSFAIAAMETQVKELEWRLTSEMEGVLHPWPTT